MSANILWASIVLHVIETTCGYFGVLESLESSLPSTIGVNIYPYGHFRNTALPHATTILVGEYGHYGTGIVPPPPYHLKGMYHFQMESNLYDLSSKEGFHTSKSLVVQRRNTHNYRNGLGEDNDASDGFKFYEPPSDFVLQQVSAINDILTPITFIKRYEKFKLRPPLKIHIITNNELDTSDLYGAADIHAASFRLEKDHYGKYFEAFFIRWLQYLKKESFHPELLPSYALHRICNKLLYSRAFMNYDLYGINAINSLFKLLNAQDFEILRLLYSTHDIHSIQDLQHNEHFVPDNSLYLVRLLQGALKDQITQMIHPTHVRNQFSKKIPYIVHVSASPYKAMEENHKIHIRHIHNLIIPFLTDITHGEVLHNQFSNKIPYIVHVSASPYKTMEENHKIHVRHIHNLIIPFLTDITHGEVFPKIEGDVVPVVDGLQHNFPLESQYVQPLIKRYRSHASVETKYLQGSPEIQRSYSPFPKYVKVWPPSYGTTSSNLLGTEIKHLDHGSGYNEYADKGTTDFNDEHERTLEHVMDKHFIILKPHLEKDALRTTNSRALLIGREDKQQWSPAAYEGSIYQTPIHSVVKEEKIHDSKKKISQQLFYDERQHMRYITTEPSVLTSSDPLSYHRTSADWPEKPDVFKPLLIAKHQNSLLVPVNIKITTSHHVNFDQHIPVTYNPIVQTMSSIEPLILSNTNKQAEINVEKKPEIYGAGMKPVTQLFPMVLDRDKPVVIKKGQDNVLGHTVPENSFIQQDKYKPGLQFIPVETKPTQSDLVSYQNPKDLRFIDEGFHQGTSGISEARIPQELPYVDSGTITVSEGNPPEVSDNDHPVHSPLIFQGQIPFKPTSSIKPLFENYYHTKEKPFVVETEAHKSKPTSHQLPATPTHQHENINSHHIVKFRPQHIIQKPPTVTYVKEATSLKEPIYVTEAVELGDRKADMGSMQLQKPMFVLKEKTHQGPDTLLNILNKNAKLPNTDLHPFSSSFHITPFHPHENGLLDEVNAVVKFDFKNPERSEIDTPYQYPHVDRQVTGHRKPLVTPTFSPGYSVSTEIMKPVAPVLSTIQEGSQIFSNKGIVSGYTPWTPQPLKPTRFIKPVDIHPSFVVKSIVKDNSIMPINYQAANSKPIDKQETNVKDKKTDSVLSSTQKSGSINPITMRPSIQHSFKRIDSHTGKPFQNMQEAVSHHPIKPFHAQMEPINHNPTKPSHTDHETVIQDQALVKPQSIIQLPSKFTQNDPHLHFQHLKIFDQIGPKFSIQHSSKPIPEVSNGITYPVRHNHITYNSPRISNFGSQPIIHPELKLFHVLSTQAIDHSFLHNQGVTQQPLEQSFHHSNTDSPMGPTNGIKIVSQDIKKHANFKAVHAGDQPMNLFVTKPHYPVESVGPWSTSRHSFIHHTLQPILIRTPKNSIPSGSHTADYNIWKGDSHPEKSIFLTHQPRRDIKTVFHHPLKPTSAKPQIAIPHSVHSILAITQSNINYPMKQQHDPSKPVSIRSQPKEHYPIKPKKVDHLVSTHPEKPQLVDHHPKIHYPKKPKQVVQPVVIQKEKLQLVGPQPNIYYPKKPKKVVQPVVIQKEKPQFVGPHYPKKPKNVVQPVVIQKEKPQLVGPQPNIYYPKKPKKVVQPVIIQRQKPQLVGRHPNIHYPKKPKNVAQPMVIHQDKPKHIAPHPNIHYQKKPKKVVLPVLINREKLQLVGPHYPKKPKKVIQPVVIHRKKPKLIGSHPSIHYPKKPKKLVQPVVIYQEKTKIFGPPPKIHYPKKPKTMVQPVVIHPETPQLFGPHYTKKPKQVVQHVINNPENPQLVGPYHPKKQKDVVQPMVIHPKKPKLAGPHPNIHYPKKPKQVLQLKVIHPEKPKVVGSHPNINYPEKPKKVVQPVVINTEKPQLVDSHPKLYYPMKSEKVVHPVNIHPHTREIVASHRNLHYPKKHIDMVHSVIINSEKPELFDSLPGIPYPIKQVTYPVNIHPQKRELVAPLLNFLYPKKPKQVVQPVVTYPEKPKQVVQPVVTYPEKPKQVVQPVVTYPEKPKQVVQPMVIYPEEPQLIGPHHNIHYPEKPKQVVQPVLIYPQEPQLLGPHYTKKPKQVVQHLVIRPEKPQFVDSHPKMSYPMKSEKVVHPVNIHPQTREIVGSHLDLHYPKKHINMVHPVLIHSEKPEFVDSLPEIHYPMKPKKLVYPVNIHPQKIELGTHLNFPYPKKPKQVIQPVVIHPEKPQVVGPQYPKKLQKVVQPIIISPEKPKLVGPHPTIHYPKKTKRVIQPVVIPPEKPQLVGPQYPKRPKQVVEPVVIHPEKPQLAGSHPKIHYPEKPKKVFHPVVIHTEKPQLADSHSKMSYPMKSEKMVHPVNIHPHTREIVASHRNLHYPKKHIDMVHSVIIHSEKPVLFDSLPGIHYPIKQVTYPVNIHPQKRELVAPNLNFFYPKKPKQVVQPMIIHPEKPQLIVPHPNIHYPEKPKQVVQPVVTYPEKPKQVVQPVVIYPEEPQLIGPHPNIHYPEKPKQVVQPVVVYPEEPQLFGPHYTKKPKQVVQHLDIHPEKPQFVDSHPKMSYPMKSEKMVHPVNIHPQTREIVGSHLDLHYPKKHINMVHPVLIHSEKPEFVDSLPEIHYPMKSKKVVYPVSIHPQKIELGTHLNFPYPKKPKQVVQPAVIHPEKPQLAGSHPKIHYPEKPKQVVHPVVIHPEKPKVVGPHSTIHYPKKTKRVIQPVVIPPEKPQLVGPHYPKKPKQVVQPVVIHPEKQQLFGPQYPKRPKQVVEPVVIHPEKQQLFGPQYPKRPKQVVEPVVIHLEKPQLVGSHPKIHYPEKPKEVVQPVVIHPEKPKVVGPHPNIYYPKKPKQVIQPVVIQLEKTQPLGFQYPKKPKKVVQPVVIHPEKPKLVGPHPNIHYPKKPKQVVQPVVIQPGKPQLVGPHYSKKPRKVVQPVVIHPENPKVVGPDPNIYYPKKPKQVVQPLVIQLEKTQLLGFQYPKKLKKVVQPVVIHPEKRNLVGPHPKIHYPKKPKQVVQPVVIHPGKPQLFGPHYSKKPRKVVQPVVIHPKKPQLFGPHYPKKPKQVVQPVVIHTEKPQLIGPQYPKIPKKVVQPVVISPEKPKLIGSHPNIRYPEKPKQVVQPVVIHPEKLKLVDSHPKMLYPMKPANMVHPINIHHLVGPDFKFHYPKKHINVVQPVIIQPEIPQLADSHPKLRYPIKHEIAVHPLNITRVQLKIGQHPDNGLVIPHVVSQTVIQPLLKPNHVAAEPVKLHHPVKLAHIEFQHPIHDPMRINHTKHHQIFHYPMKLNSTKPIKIELPSHTLRPVNFETMPISFHPLNTDLEHIQPSISHPMNLAYLKAQPSVHHPVRISNGGPQPDINHHIYPLNFGSQPVIRYAENPDPVSSGNRVKFMDIWTQHEFPHPAEHFHTTIQPLVRPTGKSVKVGVHSVTYQPVKLDQIDHESMTQYPVKHTFSESQSVMNHVPDGVQLFIHPNIYKSTKQIPMEYKSYFHHPESNIFTVKPIVGVHSVSDHPIKPIHLRTESFIQQSTSPSHDGKRDIVDHPRKSIYVGLQPLTQHQGIPVQSDVYHPQPVTTHNERNPSAELGVKSINDWKHPLMYNEDKPIHLQHESFIHPPKKPTHVGHMANTYRENLFAKDNYPSVKPLHIRTHSVTHDIYNPVKSSHVGTWPLNHPAKPSDNQPHIPEQVKSVNAGSQTHIHYSLKLIHVTQKPVIPILMKQIHVKPRPVKLIHVTPKLITHPPVKEIQSIINHPMKEMHVPVIPQLVVHHTVEQIHVKPQLVTLKTINPIHVTPKSVIHFPEKQIHVKPQPVIHPKAKQIHAIHYPVKSNQIDSQPVKKLQAKSIHIRHPAIDYQENQMHVLLQPLPFINSSLKPILPSVVGKPVKHDYIGSLLTIPPPKKPPFSKTKAGTYHPEKPTHIDLNPDKLTEKYNLNVFQPVKPIHIIDIDIIHPAKPNLAEPRLKLMKPIHVSHVQHQTAKSIPRNPVSVIHHVVPQPSIFHKKPIQVMSQRSIHHMKPTQVVYQPSIRHKKPTLVVHQPSIHQKKPTQVVHQPSIRRKKPTLVVHQPSIHQKKPAQVVHQPSIRHKKPTQVVHQPSIRHKKLTQVLNQPSIRHKNPTQVVNQPSIPRKNPTQVVPQPSIPRKNPTQVVPQPYIPRKNPTQVVPQPYIPRKNPTQVVPQPSIHYKKPTQVLHQPYIRHKKPTQVVHQTAIRHKKPIQVVPQPSIRHKKPTQVVPQPSIRHKKPTQVVPQPSIRHKKPTQVVPQPSIHHKKPTQVVPQPSILHRKPTQVVPQPSILHRKPTQVVPQPSIRHKKPTQVVIHNSVRLLDTEAEPNIYYVENVPVYAGPHPGRPIHFESKYHVPQLMKRGYNLKSAVPQERTDTETHLYQNKEIDFLGYLKSINRRGHNETIANQIKNTATETVYNRSPVQSIFLHHLETEPSADSIKYSSLNLEDSHLKPGSPGNEMQIVSEIEPPFYGDSHSSDIRYSFPTKDIEHNVPQPSKINSSNHEMETNDVSNKYIESEPSYLNKLHSQYGNNIFLKHINLTTKEPIQIFNTDPSKSIDSRNYEITVGKRVKNLEHIPRSTPELLETVFKEMHIMPGKEHHFIDEPQILDRGFHFNIKPIPAEKNKSSGQESIRFQQGSHLKPITIENAFIHEINSAKGKQSGLVMQPTSHREKIHHLTEKNYHPKLHSREMSPSSSTKPAVTVNRDIKSDKIPRTKVPSVAKSHKGEFTLKPSFHNEQKSVKSVFPSFTIQSEDFFKSVPLAEEAIMNKPVVTSFTNIKHFVGKPLRYPVIPIMNSTLNSEKISLFPFQKEAATIVYNSTYLKDPVIAQRKYSYQIKPFKQKISRPQLFPSKAITIRQPAPISLETNTTLSLKPVLVAERILFEKKSAIDESPGKISLVVGNSHKFRPLTYKMFFNKESKTTRNITPMSSFTRIKVPNKVIFKPLLSGTGTNNKQTTKIVNIKPSSEKHLHYSTIILKSVPIKKSKLVNKTKLMIGNIKPSQHIILSTKQPAIQENSHTFRSEMFPNSKGDTDLRTPSHILSASVNKLKYAFPHLATLRHKYDFPHLATYKPVQTLKKFNVELRQSHNVESIIPTLMKPVKSHKPDLIKKGQSMSVKAFSISVNDMKTAPMNYSSNVSQIDFFAENTKIFQKKELEPESRVQFYSKANYYPESEFSKPSGQILMQSKIKHLKPKRDKYGGTLPLPTISSDLVKPLIFHEIDFNSVHKIANPAKKEHERLIRTKSEFGSQVNKKLNHFAYVEKPFIRPKLLTPRDKFAQRTEFLLDEYKFPKESRFKFQDYIKPDTFNLNLLPPQMFSKTELNSLNKKGKTHSSIGSKALNSFKTSKVKSVYFDLSKSSKHNFPQEAKSMLNIQKSEERIVRYEGSGLMKHQKAVTFDATKPIDHKRTKTGSKLFAHRIHYASDDEETLKPGDKFAKHKNLLPHEDLFPKGPSFRFQEHNKPDTFLKTVIKTLEKKSETLTSMKPELMKAFKTSKEKLVPSDSSKYKLPDMKKSIKRTETRVTPSRHRVSHDNDMENLGLHGGEQLKFKKQVHPKLVSKNKHKTISQVNHMNRIKLEDSNTEASTTLEFEDIHSNYLFDANIPYNFGNENYYDPNEGKHQESDGKYTKTKNARFLNLEDVNSHEDNRRERIYPYEKQTVHYDVSGKSVTGHQDDFRDFSYGDNGRYENIYKGYVRGLKTSRHMHRKSVDFSQNSQISGKSKSVITNKMIPYSTSDNMKTIKLKPRVSLNHGDVGIKLQKVRSSNTEARSYNMAHYVPLEEDNKVREYSHDRQYIRQDGTHGYKKETIKPNFYFGNKQQLKVDNSLPGKRRSLTFGRMTAGNKIRTSTVDDKLSYKKDMELENIKSLKREVEKGNVISSKIGFTEKRSGKGLKNRLKVKLNKTSKNDIVFNILLS